MKAKHAEKTHKITISLWLFIAIIAVLVLLIVGITFYSVNRELNAENNSTATATQQVQTTNISTQPTTEQATENAAVETTQPETKAEETTAEQTTQSIAVSGAESADKDLNFDAEMYPYKAFDNEGKRDASLKEVFGSVYGGEGIFSDNITQTEYNFGAYTVTDGVINMTYSNDKNKSAEIISYNGNVPSEIKIDYVGYDVYFKIRSAD